MYKHYVWALKQFNQEKMTKINMVDTKHCFCDIYCLLPGQAQKLHAHTDADKIYYVLAGEGTFQIGEETEALGNGHCILAPAGVPHGVQNSTQEELVLLVFMSPNPNFP